MRPSSTIRPFVTDDDPVGVLDPDFLALGLGGTNMLAMLWTVAMGKRAVGVEMRGDPFLGVHWNIRVDLYHQLGLIDRMMLERFGEQGVPRRADGRLFKLAECFFSTQTVAGDIVADEIIDGFDQHQHIVGTIHHVEFIDDRWRDGLPNRVVTLLQPPPAPTGADPSAIRTDMVDVLDGPSTFQAGAASILVLLRRYLERIERLDLDAGREPRVRLFTRHRVVPGEGDGFIRREDGRLAIRIEALQELDYKGKFLRVRVPGSDTIDLGVPELFVIAQGFHSTDAERLGFQQEDVVVDHHDGRGPVVAQADFLAGLIEVLVGGRLRRRIASEFDDEGREYWTRQIAVGHENDPEVGWVLVQVPDFKTFDPVEAGLVPSGTPVDSPAYFAAYQNLIYDYYIEQSADILELPPKELKRAQMVYGPKLFSLVERMGTDARVAANGVVAGDSFGNGHFLTSGGAMTGMVGHGSAVLRYWEAREAGASKEDAIRALADDIKRATLGWLHVSAKEYSDAVPINFGAERIRQLSVASGIDVHARAHSIDATRRQRHALLPLDPSDWRRLFLRNGQVMSAPLPELHAMHPELRRQTPAKRGAKATVAYVTPDLSPATVRTLDALLGQPGVRLGLITSEPVDRLPADVCERLAAHAHVSLATDLREIADAVGEIQRTLGRPDLLLGVADELQTPLGEVRQLMRITGMKASVARDIVDRARMREVLVSAGLPVLMGDSEADEDASELSLQVMTVGRVPAWFSGTRRRGRAIILPREVDDPADVTVRRLAFAALRALGLRTGLSTITWRHGMDGTPAIADVSICLPDVPVMSLMSHAHGADMYRAWSNAVVNGLFTPIPRLYAAAAALLPVDGASSAVEVDAAPEYGRLAADLRGLIVETRVPNPGEPAGLGTAGGGWIVVRHPETSVVEQAISHVLSSVREQLGESAAVDRADSPTPKPESAPPFHERPRPRAEHRSTSL